MIFPSFYFLFHQTFQSISDSRVSILSVKHLFNKSFYLCYLLLLVSKITESVKFYPLILNFYLQLPLPYYIQVMHLPRQTSGDKDIIIRSAGPVSKHIYDNQIDRIIQLCLVNDIHVIHMRMNTGVSREVVMLYGVCMNELKVCIIQDDLKEV